MNLKHLRPSVIAVALLATLIAVSACGKKGDPVRPGEEPAEKDAPTAPVE